ncbi:hypothetical protein F5Y04DRAFT_249405 [Hypomontagnella monticulosa]|nr:hypothetical protein F5Y04DRAFT_249405 [Hypomontagnella monticulosa]
MSAPNCVSCEGVLSCEDSPLSVTGNIVGILTFVSAILISAQVYFNSMRNADRNIRDLMATFESRYDELVRLERKLRSSHIDGSSSGKFHHTLDGVCATIYEAKALLGQLCDEWSSRRRRMLTRAKFVLREDIIREGMEKTETGIEILRGLADDVPTEATPEMKEILQTLAEMKDEIKSIKVENSQVLQEVRELLRESYEPVRHTDRM